MEHQQQKGRQPCPQNQANCLSRATFWWASGLLRLGYRREVREEDIPEVLPDDTAVKLSGDLGREWEKELYTWRTGGRPSLFSSLFRCYGLNVIGIGIVFFLVESLRVVQAVLLGLIVMYFEPNSSVTQLHAYLYAAAWSVTYIFIILLDNLAFHLSLYYGLRMRVACTSLIYRKLLRLSHISLEETSTTTIVNLLGAEAHRFDQICLCLGYLWVGPVEAVAVTALLWLRVGLGQLSLLSLFLILLLVPAQFALGRYLSKLRHQMSQLSDRRMHVMSEIIYGMRTIKVNCWEKAFTQLVTALRRSEWTFLGAMSNVRAMTSALYLVSGKIIMFATFAAFLLQGASVSPAALFTALALCEVLRASVGLLLPWSIQYFIQAREAVTRIQTFLLLEERSLVEQHCHTLGGATGHEPLPSETALQLEDYTTTWGNAAKDKSAFMLRSLSFTIPKGNFVVLTGPKRAGKTSLLLSLTGEVPRLGGLVRAAGRAVYVPQQPWVLPTTIRDNVLFGAQMDRRRYAKVLHACALSQDVEALACGDQSVVGESGVNLTDSQKVRVCLARAVYQEADIYLIDDIFHSLDDRTAMHIFTKCFCGLILSRTVVLVSHSRRYIQAADLVLVLEQGRLSHVSTYNELRISGINFAELLADYSDHHGSGDPRVIREPGVGEMEEMVSLGRRTLGVDSSYGSQESLDQIWMDHDATCSDTDQQLNTDAREPSSGRGYLRYLRRGAGLCGVTLFVVCSLLAQVTYVLCDWWLYKWSIDQSSEVLSNTTSSTWTTTPVTYFYVYLGVLVAVILLCFLQAAVFSVTSSRTSRKLHANLFSAVMRAPMSFFEKHQPGEILWRFAQDVGFVDDSLPANYFDCVQFLLLVVGALVVAAVADYWMLLIIAPLVAIFLLMRCYFVTTARDLKRVETHARTPLSQHLSQSLDGLYVIRAFSAEERFLRQFDGLQDQQTAASYMYLAISRWFALRLDVISVVFVSLLAVISIAVRDSINPGLLGLALVYALNVMALFQYTLRQSAELENQLAGVEKIESYIQVPSEGALITNVRPAAVWPQYGIVTFEGLSLIKDDEPVKVLRNIWGCVRAQEKLGILGNPDSGKRALVTALLRLAEPSHGIVRIDGLDISELGLHDLRDRISVIQQDPLLFGGSLRRNLDPFTRHPDATLWKALTEVQLKEKVESLPGKLYADMAAFGNNFCVAERQLLGLVQTLVKSAKLVIFEESTSFVDKRHESLFRHILLQTLHRSTVIVIAQKLQTVIDTDRVMILEEGKLRELDPPHILLQNKSSAFSQMLHQLPSKEISVLRQLAMDKYENKPYQPPPQGIGGELALPYAARSTRHFMPAFQTNRLTGVLSNFTGNRFSTNRF